MERTFVMVKPDGVQRGLAGNVIARFEAKGFKLVGLKLMTVSRELAEKHYGVHKERPFFGKLVDFIISSPVVAMVWEGKDVISAARNVIGSTNPIEAAPGTIRGDFGMDIGRNLIHGSDGVQTAADEIKLWFKDEELVSWDSSASTWLYE